MNILGIGTWELIAIFIIMLLVAGPERMIRWAYYIGRFAGQARRWWAQTMDVFQQEFNKAGIDVELPKSIPNRRNLSKRMGKELTKLTGPIREPLDEIDAAMSEVKESVAPANPTTPAKSPAKVASNGHSTKGDSGAFGTWSQHDDAKRRGFGTWSQPGDSDDE